VREAHRPCTKLRRILPERRACSLIVEMDLLTDGAKVRGK
jgi:hypothetical protein